MRWFMAGVLALFLTWGAFLVSPYWALRDLAAAVQERDASRVAGRVNFRALRHSMAKQLVTELSGHSGPIGPAGSPIAAASLAAAMDPLLELFLTPEAVVGLLGMPQEEETAPKPPLADRGLVFDRIDAFLQASNWRGFRNVYFSLPLDAPRAARFRLQLRLGGFSWRLVGIDLPANSRRQVAEAVLSRQRSATP